MLKGIIIAGNGNVICYCGICKDILEKGSILYET